MADVFIKWHKRERTVQLGSLLFVPVNIGLICYLGVSDNLSFAVTIFLSIALQTWFNLWFVCYPVTGVLFLALTAPLTAILIVSLVLLLLFDIL